MNKFSLSVLLAMLPGGQARGWDQLGEFKFNSHSVITRDAVMSVNEALRASRGAELEAWTRGLYDRLTEREVSDLFPMGRSELNGGFYPEKHLDDGTHRTANRLQQGNTAADHPKKLSLLAADRFLYGEYCSFMGAAGKACNDLPNAGRGMPLHFTREFEVSRGPNGPSVVLSSARKTCETSVGLVKALTLKARDHWDAAKKAEDRADAMREYERMYLMLGVAAHAIEDSFAPAHVQRSGRDPRALEDLCYYYDNRVLPPSKAGACAHIVGVGKEPRDSIYFEGDGTHPGNAPLRKAATDAAKAYLLGFAEAMLDDAAGRPADLEAFLQRFLTDKSAEGAGYLDCSSLP